MMTLEKNGRSPRNVKLGMPEKIAYGFGDAGFNLYWATIGSFLAAFYTDYFGISAAAAGTMLLVTKIIDAFTDPVMGAIADRTNTRFGKFRPYLIWGGVPLAIAGVLAFTRPDLTELGRIIWAYATFTLLMLTYTFVSTPYSALSAVMTADSQERITLFSLRFLFAFSCGAAVGAFTLDLVAGLGGNNLVLGWQLTMALYGVLTIVIFAITFSATKERISPPPRQKTNPVQDIKDLLKNRPWIVLFVLALIIMMTITMRGGSAYYYFYYYVERPDLLPKYLSLQMIAYALGAATAPLMAKFIEKRKLLILLMGIVATLSILFFFVPKDMVWAMFTLNILISLALGPKSPLTWSMYADSADYNEWKMGRRATAMTFSAATFSQKLGGAFGSSFMLWILAAIGYVANHAQSGASQTGIALLQTVIPGVFAFFAMITVFFYPLGSKQLEKIQNELAVRS